MIVASQFSVVSPLTDAFDIYITNAADPGDFLYVVNFLGAKSNIWQSVILCAIIEKKEKKSNFLNFIFIFSNIWLIAGILAHS